ncbi:hypothetical protein QBC37DRAFT_63402 [Rhypophila decipiens]|uniref:DUF6536 domain-containing protein n=1 Tax=Rhypophila decipiens TaxID=261697 RepID=A0AAN6YEI1_9PEZI|nr:hypothetical protein QBC37DRAFT_63402 [Rhypophila decipiens]
MEIVIPPRDHRPLTYQYTWDENGEVTNITRIKEDGPVQERPRRGRQTVQWPFQSISNETEISSPTTVSHYAARRATWEPKRAMRARVGDTDSIAQDLIPDYVINYMRGETPETVARRKQNGGKLAERGVDIRRHKANQQSRTADFEGFLHDASSRSGASSGDANDESRHILSSSKKKGEGGVRKRFLPGWRAGIELNLFLTLLIFLAGVGCLIAIITRGPISSGESILFSGLCSTASSINWGLHGVINLFAVALIAGANYVFQVLSSPTRMEVSVAHQKKRWLDIGIPSIRNLTHIQGVRTLIIVVVLIAAVTTQIIYNAALSTSQTSIDYKLLLVTDSFLDGGPFSNDTTSNGAQLSRLDILALQGKAVRNELVNLTTTDCFAQFSGAYETTYSAALLVSDLGSETTPLIQTSRAVSSIITDLAPEMSSIKYCLTQTGPEPICSVAVNIPLLGAITALNLLTALTLGLVLLLFRKSFHPLATLGDAISSFLQDPDPTTRGSCLLSKTDVWQGRWGQNPDNGPGASTIAGAKYFVPRDHFWFGSLSLPRLVSVLFVWLACVGLTVSALALSIVADPRSRLSPFGTGSEYSTVILPSILQATTTSRLSSTVSAALIAALPHILLAALYLSVNSLLTIFFLSHESSLFAVGPHRPLRVSNGRPEGSQISSLYLTLPRPISWFLVILFAGMGFTLSQSVFLTPLDLVHVDLASGSLFEDSSSSPVQLVQVATMALSFSGVGLFILLGMFIFLAIVVTVLGLRRAPPAAFVNGQAMGNPLTLPAGSCSAVISARCHLTLPRDIGRLSTSGLGSAGLWYGSSFPPIFEEETTGNHPSGSRRGQEEGEKAVDENSELWKKELAWGVVRQGVGMQVSHASFTASGPVVFLDVARCYA